MDYTELKLFYKTPGQDKDLKLTLTCEEGKIYEDIAKNSDTKISIPSNNTDYHGILKMAAITIFTLIIEPLYENL